MSAAARIGAFAGLLIVVFAAATLAGARINPDVEESGSEKMSEHEEHPGAATASTGLPGLAVAQDGYRLVTAERSLAAGMTQSLRFRVERDDGSTVTGFDVEHERRMHLILVRRDFQGFQHLHPEMNDDGNWSVEVDDLEPGVYRAFADFSTDGHSLTLATDLFVPGPFHPYPLAPVSGTAAAGDGYEVTIDSPGATGGETVPTGFEVTRNGRAIDEVEPYLGADGHLVALREGDQAFLHTHPQGEAGGPGPISFDVNYPTAGRYRLFLQFKHAGKVHTAAFTRVVRPAGHEDEGEGAEQHG